MLACFYLPSVSSCDRRLCCFICSVFTCLFANESRWKVKNGENKAVASEVESTFLRLSVGEMLQQKFGSVQDESAVGRRDGAEDASQPTVPTGQEQSAAAELVSVHPVAHLPQLANRQQPNW